MRNEKGEDWPKFLKEIQGPEMRAVAAKLRADKLPKNRQAARMAGMKNVEEAVNKQIANIAERDRFRTWKVNSWFDEMMQKGMPRTFKLANKYRSKWLNPTLLFKLMGFRFKVDDRRRLTSEPFVTVPYTYCEIKWLWQFKAGVNLFWENPNDPEVKRGGRTYTPNS